MPHFRKSLVAAAAVVAASLLSSPASAAFPDCAVTDISPTADACEGWFEGNLLNAEHLTEQEAALEALLGGDITLTQDIFDDLVKVQATGDTFDFDGFLDGEVVVGIKIGGDDSNELGWTGFFLITADNLTSITLADLPGGGKGASSAVVYPGNGTVVPEPATWAMMLLGFGATGFVIRRRRKAGLAQLA